MSRNIERLGDILVKRMTVTSNAAVGVYTELGTINPNMTLTPDSLLADIPQEEYLVLDGATINPNDRVLIAWAGNEAVVIGTASTTESPTALKVTSDGEGNVTIDLE